MKKQHLPKKCVWSAVDHLHGAISGAIVGRRLSIVRSDVEEVVITKAVLRRYKQESCR